MWQIESGEGILIRLGFLAALLSARRSVFVDPRDVRSVRVMNRGDLELAIENRVLGLGTSIGRRWRGRTRVGRFLGRAVVGEQFWAVPAGDAESMPLLVIDLEPSSGPFARVVCHVDDAEAVATRLRESAGA